MVRPAVADLTSWSFRLRGYSGKHEARRFAGRASTGWEDAKGERRSQNTLRENSIRTEQRGSEKKNPARDAGGVVEIEV
jgi:hypothetical protein